MPLTLYRYFPVTFTDRFQISLLILSELTNLNEGNLIFDCTSQPTQYLANDNNSNNNNINNNTDVKCKTLFFYDIFFF